MPVSAVRNAFQDISPYSKCLSMESVDIGICVTRYAGQLKRLFCLDDIVNNFCCQLSNASVLIHDTGERTCCSFDQYLDLQWGLIGSIQGFMILLSLAFITALATSLWIFLRTRGIRESEVKESRRHLIKHLFKQQMLVKSRRADPSIVDALKNFSITLSSDGSRRQRIPTNPSNPSKSSKSLKSYKSSKSSKSSNKSPWSPKRLKIYQV